MYVKLHDSIFGSSIMEQDIEIRYIWMCLLAIADGDGFVDETIPALARRFNVSEKIMAEAINVFLSPDPQSRTPDNDGRRIEPIRETYGWHIINYQKYKDIRDYESRTEYMREYMRKYRKPEDVSKQTVYASKQSKLSKPNQNKNQNINIIYAHFAQFWEAYPRKVDKKRALKIWERLKPDEKTTSTILDAIAKQKRTKEQKKAMGEFVPEWPHPTTWLNGERWEDEDINPKDSGLCEKCGKGQKYLGNLCIDCHYRRDDD